MGPGPTSQGVPCRQVGGPQHLRGTLSMPRAPQAAGELWSFSRTLGPDLQGQNPPGCFHPIDVSCYQGLGLEKAPGERQGNL